MITIHQLRPGNAKATENGCLSASALRGPPFLDVHLHRSTDGRFVGVSLIPKAQSQRLDHLSL